MAELMNNIVINSGEAVGGVDLMIKLFDMMAKSKNVCMDQGFLNYLYYSGIMQKEFGIDAIPLPHNSEIFTAIAVFALKGTLRVDPESTLGSIRINGNLPALIHQFDRDPNYKVILNRACPNFYPPFPDYLRSG